MTIEVLDDLSLNAFPNDVYLIEEMINVNLKFDVREDYSLPLSNLKEICAPHCREGFEFVYVLELPNDLCKIGFSHNLHYRMQGFISTLRRGANPILIEEFRLRCLIKTRNGRFLERKLHDMLSDMQVDFLAGKSDYFVIKWPTLKKAIKASSPDSFKIRPMPNAVAYLPISRSTQKTLTETKMVGETYDDLLQRLLKERTGQGMTSEAQP